MPQNNEIIQAVVKRYPRARCLWCGNFEHQAAISPTGGRVDLIVCKVGASIPCGRAFNPKQGGDLVTA